MLRSDGSVSSSFGRDGEPSRQEACTDLRSDTVRSTLGGSLPHGGFPDVRA